jgi:hypothetical protein
MGIIIGMIVGFTLIASVIGAIVLMLLAKFIGKIENAKFGNSYLICFISSLVTTAILAMLGTDLLLAMGFGGIIALNILLLAVVYITVGKFIWNCEWMQSVKANILWIILYAFLMGIMVSKIPSY